MYILFLFLACGEKADTAVIIEDTSSTDTGNQTDTSDTEDSGEDTGATGSCEELTTEECHERSDCFTRQGHPLSFDEANQCWNIEPGQDTNCLSMDTGCGDAITYAHPPDSEECWMFTDTCIPADWISCDYPEEPECNG